VDPCGSRPEFDTHTCTQGVLGRPSHAESLRATATPETQTRRIQAGHRGRPTPFCPGSVPGPSRDGADTSDASAPPPLTALLVAAPVMEISRNTSCGCFCGRLCGRPQPNVASMSTSIRIPQTPDERLVYTVAEAGELLGISRAFAYELVARGDLPVICLGRRRLVPKVALLALVGQGSAEIRDAPPLA
jgi:excisionase family DNA binding protein